MMLQNFGKRKDLGENVKKKKLYINRHTHTQIEKCIIEIDYMNYFD